MYRNRYILRLKGTQLIFPDNIRSSINGKFANIYDIVLKQRDLISKLREHGR